MDNDAFNELAWRDFILWAIENEGVRAQFRKETGKALFRPPENQFERLIDNATGLNADQPSEEIVLSFVIWATTTLWGTEYAPKKLHKLINA